MATKSIFLFSSFSLLLAASTAFADGRRLGGMSQLDFDRPSEAMMPIRKSPTGDEINLILNEDADSAPKAPSNAKPETAKAGKADATARASLDLPPASKTPTAATAMTKFDWEKPQEGTAHYLIPRLKGPAVDKDNVQVITTEATWRRTSAIACQDVTDPEALCGKAKALKEVMRRFSGSDEFFDTQCQQTCPNPGQKAVLTAFAVKPVAEGEFRMSDSNKVCRYQIKSNVEPPRWQMLQGERGTCTCLSNSCL